MELEIWRAGCFGFVLLWFALLFALSSRLKAARPAAYESVGLPALLANPFKGTWILGVFLYSGQFLRLRDPIVSVVSATMCVWFIGALLWMFGPFAGLFALA
jgi:hypothetical protein